MTPLTISIVAFFAVSTMVGLVALALRDTGSKSSDRLDVLVGKRRADDPATDILKKTAFESDKRSMLEILTPNLPSLQKIFEQANCHKQMSTIFGVGLILALLGTTASWLARVPWFLAPLG